MLICERMRFRYKMNRVLFLGGILSLSFYFFISLFLGMLLFADRSKKNWKLMVFLVILTAISYQIPQVYNTIWSRFVWDADAGTFVGNNRQDQIFSDFWDTIKGTPLMITGVGSIISSEYIGTSASLLVVIAKHGLLFVVPIISAFLIMAGANLTVGGNGMFSRCILYLHYINAQVSIRLTR